MHERIRGSRQLCAAAWTCIFLLAATSIVFEASLPAGYAVIGSLIVALLTLGLGKFEPEESLARPRTYRVIIGAWFAVTLVGAVLALLPGSSYATRFFGGYFGVVAVFAYRAVVARGPRRAISGVVIAILLWFPLVLLLATENTGVQYPPPPHWTEAATFLILRGFLLMLPIVAAAALVTFDPRPDQVPGARLVRDNH